MMLQLEHLIVTVFTKCQPFSKFVINSIKSFSYYCCLACDLSSNSPVVSFDYHMHQNQITDSQLQCILMVHGVTACYKTDETMVICESEHYLIQCMVSLESYRQAVTTWCLVLSRLHIYIVRMSYNDSYYVELMYCIFLCT